MRLSIELAPKCDKVQYYTHVTLLTLLDLNISHNAIWQNKI